MTYNLSLQRTYASCAGWSAEFKRYGSNMRHSISAVFLCVLTPLSVRALDVACPAKIVTAERLAVREVGWTGFVDSDKSQGRVIGLSIYSGHPSDMAELKPDDEMAKEQRWTFGRASSDSQPIYMVCHYDATRVKFIKALPKAIGKCSIKRLGLLRCEIES